MKKILSIAAALVVAAAFISCGDSGDSFEADTVISVGTPSVKAKAYPGVNYVTWTPVEKATKYEVYRSVGDAAPKLVSTVNATSGNPELGYADYAKNDNDLVNGVTYKYTIFTVGGNPSSQVSRDVYVKTTSATASVKATVPAFGTDITAFDAKTYKDVAKYLAQFADDAAMKNAGVLKATQVNDDEIAVAYPVIPGLKYGIVVTNPTRIAAGITSKKATTFTSNFIGGYVANVSTKASLGAGKYKAYLTVAALSDLYTTSAIYDLGDVTIAAIDEATATSDFTATYNAEGKVVLTWVPAVLANGSKEAVANYKVYRAAGKLQSGKIADGIDLTEVTGTITSMSKVNSTTVGSVGTDNTVANYTVGTDGEVSEVYTITDTVPDASAAYSYVVINSNNGKVTKNPQYVQVTGWAKNTTTAPTFVVSGTNRTELISFDATNYQNTIKVVGKRANSYQTLTLSYLNIDSVVDGTVPGTSYKQLFTASDFKTDVKMDSNNDATEETYIGYIKGQNPGTYLLKLTATDSRADYAPQSSYYTVQIAGKSAPNASNITITNNHGTMAADYAAYVLDSQPMTEEQFKLYKYYLVKVTVQKDNTTYSDNVTVTTDASSEIKLEKHAAATTATATNDDYVKYGLLSAGATATNYGVIVTGKEIAKVPASTTGKATEVTWSVKKTLASDEAHFYAYSDNNNNGKITRSW